MKRRLLLAVTALLLLAVGVWAAPGVSFKPSLGIGGDPGNYLLYVTGTPANGEHAAVVFRCHDTVWNECVTNFQKDTGNQEKFQIIVGGSVELTAKRDSDGEPIGVSWNSGPVAIRTEHELGAYFGGGPRGWEFYAPTTLKGNLTAGPPTWDCTGEWHRGMLAVDVANKQLWVCMGYSDGWWKASLTK